MNYLRDSLGEFIGTMVLVFLTIMSVYVAFYSGMESSIAYVFKSVMVGVSLIISYYCFAPYGRGHFNPAVTFAALLCRKIGLVECLLYFLGQFLGAVVGAYAAAGSIMLINGGNLPYLPTENIALDGFEGMYYIYFLLLIAFVTTIYYFFYLQVISRKENNGRAGLVLGVGLASISMFLGMFSSGMPPALNPFLTLGADMAYLLSGNPDAMESWSVSWLFVVIPFLGASFGSGLFVLWNHTFNKLRHIRSLRK